MEPLVPELVYEPLGILGARWPDDHKRTKLVRDPKADALQLAMRAAILGLD